MSSRRTIRAVGPDRRERGDPYPDYEGTGGWGLLEQIIKRLPRARARRGIAAARRRGAARLPLDRRARGEHLAHVAFVFRRHPRAELRALRALPPGAGVERHALDAAVQIDAAAVALAHELDGQR